jgi:A nuclease family of the HNH/ENDO VII superfamily with conserved AHH
LDVGGCVPVFGELADGVNFLLYAAEGDAQNASFSALSMIPFGGDIGAKTTKYTLKLNDGGSILLKGTKFLLSKAALKRVTDVKAAFGDDIAKAFAQSFNWTHYRAKVAALALAKGYKKWQAHHILPRELIESSETLRKAMLQGFDFNDVKNLIPLDYFTRHSGSHPAYTFAVEELIDKLKKSGKYLGNEKLLIEDALKMITLKIEKTTGKINLITSF